MAAAGCRENANFWVGSNPWGLDTPKTKKNMHEKVKSLRKRASTDRKTRTCYGEIMSPPPCL